MKSMHFSLQVLRMYNTNSQLNEYKTDLCTICSGLGILMINGLQYTYRSTMYTIYPLEALGRIMSDKPDQTITLGYFNPHTYCKYFTYYIDIIGIRKSDVVGYIHPLIRTYLPSGYKTSKTTTKLAIVYRYEKILRRNTFLYGFLTFASASFILWHYTRINIFASIYSVISQLWR